MPISLRLKEVREAKGLSQARLAELSGIRQGSISKMESGQTKGIDFVTLDRLAMALEVNPCELLDVGIRWRVRQKAPRVSKTKG